MQEGPTENRLGELGSLYKYKLPIIRPPLPHLIYRLISLHQKKKTHGYKPPPLACIEMNLTFYDAFLCYCFFYNFIIKVSVL